MAARRAARSSRARTPYAPIENEEWYATSTRVRWPGEWSREDLVLKAAGVSTAAGRRGMRLLLRAKAAQRWHDDRALQENDGSMDAIARTSEIASCLRRAWEGAKEDDLSEKVEAWRGAVAASGSGLFDIHAVGLEPFGIATPVPLRARRQADRTQAGAGASRLKGAFRFGDPKFGHHTLEKRALERAPSPAHADDLALDLSSLDDLSSLEVDAYAETPRAGPPPRASTAPARGARRRRTTIVLAAASKTARYAGPRSHVFHEREHTHRSSALRGTVGIRIAAAAPSSPARRATAARKVGLRGTPKAPTKSGLTSLLADQVDLARTSVGKKCRLTGKTLL